MFETLKNAWKLPDLKKRICYTLMIIVIFRFGAALPVPFLDASVMQGFGDGNLLGFFNIGIVLTVDIVRLACFKKIVFGFGDNECRT